MKHTGRTTHLAHRNLKRNRRDWLAEHVEKGGALNVNEDSKDSSEAPHDQLRDGNVTEEPFIHVLQQTAFE